MPAPGTGSPWAPPARGTVVALPEEDEGQRPHCSLERPWTSSHSGFPPVLSGAEQGHFNPGHDLLWGFLGSQLDAPAMLHRADAQRWGCPTLQGVMDWSHPAATGEGRGVTGAALIQISTQSN